MEKSWNGFEKRSWDLQKARKAFAPFKDKLIRRGIAADPKGGGGLFTKKHVFNPSLKDMTDLKPSYAGPMSIPEGLKSPAYPVENMYGKIYTKGQTTKRINPNMKGMGIPKEHIPYDPRVEKLTPAQKELYNRTVLQHEANELKYGKTPKAKDTLYGGHVSPQVLLEESNQIATMPKGFEPVQDFLKAMRKDRGLDSIEGFEFGKTRLSRHGRKHVARILLDRHRAQVNAFTKNLKEKPDMLKDVSKGLQSYGLK